jgi:hypothetical protein
VSEPWIGLVADDYLVLASKLDKGARGPLDAVLLALRRALLATR